MGQIVGSFHFKTICFVYKRLMLCIEFCIVHLQPPLCYLCFDLKRDIPDLIRSGVLVSIIALLLGNSSFVLGKSTVVFFYINNQEMHWVTRISFYLSQLLKKSVGPKLGPGAKNRPFSERQSRMPKPMILAPFQHIVACFGY